MKTAIITVAGISSRFNMEVSENEKILKAIYTEGDMKSTLLFQLLRKCMFAERILVVGGYKYERLLEYCSQLETAMKDKITLIFNEHYEDLASGYSLFLGIRKALEFSPDEILFVEGDLDVDDVSFNRIVNSPKSVLSYTFEPIYADKAVVLYKDDRGHFRYAFNSSHGLLSVDTPFSCIFNSGQTWKFTEIETLRKANDRFFNESKDGTNLTIIQNYLDYGVEIELIGYERWTNCNTKNDYEKIKSYWEKE